jgi:ABC-type transport system involved in cytochrome bd biosynthesis fused ATPase/permease subunit
LESIRNNITYISNYEYLFNDTLLNNITLYKKYDDNEIDKVINLVLVNEISTDKDKIIEEDGFNFSSGERQRIVLARSLLRNTNIYIFDEALNQIDIYREKKILKNIFDYYKDKTIIVISHRNNNRSLFDRCLILEDGKIYEK